MILLRAKNLYIILHEGGHVIIKNSLDDDGVLESREEKWELALSRYRLTLWPGAYIRGGGISSSITSPWLTYYSLGRDYKDAWSVVKVRLAPRD